MKRVKIKIDGINDIIRFIEQAVLVEEPGVHVYKGSVVIDGTSLVGMLSLDTSKGIEVEYPSSAENFSKYLKDYLI